MYSALRRIYTQGPLYVCTFAYLGVVIYRLNHLRGTGRTSHDDIISPALSCRLHLVVIHGIAVIPTLYRTYTHSLECALTLIHTVARVTRDDPSHRRVHTAELHLKPEPKASWRILCPRRKRMCSSM